MNVRDPNQSLAVIKIQKLQVNGHMNMDGSLFTEAWLQNMVLEDSRPQTETEMPEKRIKELMKAKHDTQKMVEIFYKQDANGNQDVEITIHSFIMVGNVSYFFEIANFFIPETSPEWQKYSIEDLPDVVNNEDERKQCNIFFFLFDFFSLILKLIHINTLKLVL